MQQQRARGAAVRPRRRLDEGQACRVMVAHCIPAPRQMPPCLRTSFVVARCRVEREAAWMAWHGMGVALREKRETRQLLLLRLLGEEKAGSRK